MREVLGRGRAVDCGGEARGAVAGGGRGVSGGASSGGGEAVATAEMVVRSEGVAAEGEKAAERRGGGSHGLHIGTAANLPYLTNEFVLHPMTSQVLGQMFS